MGMFNHLFLIFSFFIFSTLTYQAMRVSALMELMLSLVDMVPVKLQLFIDGHGWTHDTLYPPLSMTLSYTTNMNYENIT